MVSWSLKRLDKTFMFSCLLRFCWTSTTSSYALAFRIHHPSSVDIYTAHPRIPLQYHHQQQQPSVKLWQTALFAKSKRRGGAANTSKRRGQAAMERQQALQEMVAQLPKSNLDFKTPPKPPSVMMADTQTNGVANDTIASTSNSPATTNSKAQQLVGAQKESVQMLTHVTEQIHQKISMEELLANLHQHGFFVVDDFLNETVVQQLEQEVCKLYYQDSFATNQKGEDQKSDKNDNDKNEIPKMTADVSQLGTGQFICPLLGGTQQYPTCPRSIEWVVSMTNKFAAQWNDYCTKTQLQQEDSMLLSDRACSRALARLFHRSALQASLQLLLLGTTRNDKQTRVEEDETTIQHAIATLRAPPFQTVLERQVLDDDNNDANADVRKLSASYYMVPSAWDVACGGHLSFSTTAAAINLDDESSTSIQEDGKDAPITMIHAKRNRLVIWKSETTKYRREPFRGSDTLPCATMLELHWVQKQ